MACDLDAVAGVPVPDGLRFGMLDHARFSRGAEHPYWGRITTPIRRFELARLEALSGLRPRRVWDLVAELDGRPAGACTLFKGSAAAGFFDVGVVPAARGRGIGTALMAHACRFAREQGCTVAILIASGMGHGMYRRVGFRDVCKMGYWYRAAGSA
jgi:GNAT superfamily N-acetyltransferase